MFMLRSTHERIVNEKNLAAISFVEYHRRIVKQQQDVIDERNREIERLKRAAALDKLAEIDSEEIKGP